jgi:spore coat protein U-like protein
MKNQTRLFLGTAAGILAACYGAPAGSATATTSLAVTATVAASCTIAASPLDFGGYDPIIAHAATPLDGTGTVAVTCITGFSATITLGQGVNPDGGSSDTTPLRRMTDGASNYLSYSLYQDASRSTLWGNTAGTGLTVTGTGLADSRTVYGRLSAGQNVPAGSYSDTVIATVTF